MKQSIFTIVQNEPVAERAFCLRLAGDASALTVPGQFVNVLVPPKFLRRPLSVCDWDEKSLTLLYKTVGDGTERLSRMQPGQTLDVLTGLGNGFDLGQSGAHPLLAGGGAGVAPLYALAKGLLRRGAKPRAVLGFNAAREVFWRKEFEALCETTVVTLDGSAGVKGFVTDALGDAPYSFLYACGPAPMLRALDAATGGPGQFSLEERMGCGFGACMGCSIRTKNGEKRVCCDGPVFGREEILW